MTQRDGPRVSREGQSGDDLRKIDGIGRVFDQRLRAAEIFTYHDLARRTPEEIAAVLAPMAGISPEHISSQARELAELPPRASGRRQHYAAFHIEFLLESDNSVRRTKVQQHQADARDTWPGWDEERLLCFLRDRIPLPVAAKPADNSGAELEHDEPPAPEPTTTQHTPTGQHSASVQNGSTSWSMTINELAPIRDGQPTSVLSPYEPSSVRLTMHIKQIGNHIQERFDFSTTIFARHFGSHDRSNLGTVRGTARGQVPLSVEVTGPALPADLYRLVAMVDVYPADHASEEPALCRLRASGDLVRVAEAP